MRRAMVIFALSIVLDAGLARAQDYVNFETVPVRPVALSPNGQRLYVTNTPDNRVEVFDVGGAGLTHVASVPVGLEPVAVNLRTDDEVWVVNHLSDSVSIIDASQDPPRVVRTLEVGDEAWDVVFGGVKAQPTDPFPRAFVSAAHRGQNHPENPKNELLPADCIDPDGAGPCNAAGLADVWVFDADSLGSSLLGAHETIVTVFGDKPRALAVSGDGATVYVGVFHSGSETTAILESAVCNGGEEAGSCGLANGQVVPGGVPGPNQDSSGTPVPAPETGIIVKWNGSAWVDALNRDWSGAVPFSLPDLDVFAIDATATNISEQNDVTPFAHVGTILYNMAVHPSGRLYVSNTEANNADRFEGPDIDGPGPITSLRGHLHESRISIVRPPQPQLSRHLNKHIVYGASFPTQFANGKDKGDSLSMPLGIEFSQDGTRLFVAAFGSNKLGAFDVSALDDDSFQADAASHISIDAAGPVGMARDDTFGRLYVYSRIDNAVSIVDLSSETQDGTSIPLHDVEPAVVTNGRHILYDAAATTSNGESACGSCHVFGDKDDVGWNLSDPSGTTVANPNLFTLPPLGGQPNQFHPMKGPMSTQTFRGMFAMGPMHWRGDRTGANAMPPVAFDDDHAAFVAFEVAFEGLLALEPGEPDPDIDAFADFALTIMPPPNPHRDLSNDLSGAETSGQNSFLNVATDGGALQCVFCHTLDQAAGHFGGEPRSSEEGEPQFFKIPHLRNVYDKHGRYGSTSGDFDPNQLGDQIRGFGVLHDGSVAHVRDFVGASVFENLTETQRDELAQYVLAFDSNLAPSVGQQVTLAAGSGTDVTDRIDLLEESADDLYATLGVPGATECSLTVKGVIAGEPRGWVFDPAQSNPPTTVTYVDDRGDNVDGGALRDLVQPDPVGVDSVLTYTCVYPQGGTRIGADRDGDGILDGEQCGDVTANGLYESPDAGAMRQYLINNTPAVFIVDKCNINGAAGGGPASCDVEDVALALRNAAGAGPAPGQSCGAAL